MRCIKRAAVAFLFAVCCVEAGDLAKELERIARPLGGRTGVSAVLVESGEHVALHGDQPFFMASVVKFPVALRALQQVDEGRLRLDQKVEVLTSDVAPGTTVLGGKFNPGGRITIRELLNYMITASDNTACDVLMRLTGGPQAAMSRVQALGIQGIRIDRMEKQLAADFGRSHTRFLNDDRDTSTPDAMAALLAKFQTGEALKPESTAVLREMMEQSAAFTNRLKGLLPPGTVVAHKTGTWRDAATNDVGIVTLPGGARHVAVAVFTNRSKRDLTTVERAIAEMARAVYDHWSPAASR